MHKFNKSWALAELALHLDAELEGDSNCQISGFAPLEKANAGQISFLANSNYKKYLSRTGASAVILTASDAKDCNITTNKIITKNPRLALAKLTKICAGFANHKNQAFIHETAVIGHDCQIGAGVTIGPNCVIGDNCVVGDNTRLHANVVLYNDIKIGKNVVIHSGAIIGAAGFGYVQDNNGQWLHLPHLSGVIIGDNTEIGANTTIDRGFLRDTIIGDNVIIDNLVQIGHNNEIGSGTAIAGCAAIAGSTKIGKRCLIAGGASIAGHIEITDNVIITATTSVHKSILKSGSYSSGMPARPSKMWYKNISRFQFLDQMAQKIKQLEKWLAEKI